MALNETEAREVGYLIVYALDALRDRTASRRIIRSWLEEARTIIDASKESV